MPQPINEANYIPAGQPCSVITYAPVTMRVPGREVDLDIRIAMPETGRTLPVILFSHGHGPSTYLSSRLGYDPLVTFYAAHGFVVIQPTHQDSKALGLDADGPEGALFWRSRATDMRWILDHLDDIEAQTPGLAGRIDRTRIGAVGHSMGGHTVCMLAGMRVLDPVTGQEVDLYDERVKAVVTLAPPGDGADLAPFAAEHYPVLANSDFTKMSTPTLIVAGDEDQNDRFSLRTDWRSDAYKLSPPSKHLLTLYGAKHSQGGVSGWDVREATDQDPERLGVVQRMTLAYLRTQLGVDEASWAEAYKALSSQSQTLGHVELK